MILSIVLCANLSPIHLSWQDICSNVLPNFKGGWPYFLVDFFILDTNPLLDLCSANIFTKYVACFSKSKSFLF